MGLYSVLEPCTYVSGGRAVQHVRPTVNEGVDIDDAVAAPLVSEGKLASWPPRGDSTPEAPEVPEGAEVPEAPARRGRTRRDAED